MTLRVFASPAARLAAEQLVPTGEFKNTATENWYRCFANCGPVSLEVLATTDREKFRAWVDDAVAYSQVRMESIFGGCPASDDVANPPTVGTWPEFTSTTARSG